MLIIFRQFFENKLPDLHDNKSISCCRSYASHILCQEEEINLLLRTIANDVFFYEDVANV